MDRYKIHVIVGAIIFVLLVMNLFLATVLEDAPGGLFTAILLGLLLGIFIGQLNLISIWAAISKGSLIVRLPWAFLLVVLMWGSYAVGPVLYDYGFAGESTFVGYLLFVGCMVTQIPLWFASRVGGWQLALDSNLDRDDQFSLRNMFLSTTLLGISLGIVRLFVSSPGIGFSETFTNEMIVFFSAAAICNLVLVLPCIWAAFRVRVTTGKILAACVIAAAISIVQFVGVCMAIGGPGREEVEWVLLFIGVNCGQMAVVWVCLGILRHQAGFRLIRKSGIGQNETANSN